LGEFWYIFTSQVVHFLSLQTLHFDLGVEKEGMEKERKIWREEKNEK